MSTPTSLLRRAYRRVRPQHRPPPPEDKVFFLHLPKCGGMSIDTALQNAYRAAGDPTIRLDAVAVMRAAELKQEDMRSHKENLLLYAMSGRYRYVGGHFAYSTAAWDAFGDEWRYVTVLRDPVKRWISNYFYNRYKQSPHFRIEESLEEFLQTKRARQYGKNYISALVDNEGREASISETTEQAIANLDRFAVVGVLEHLDTFAADCENRLGLRIDIGHRNANPRTAGQQREEVSDELMEQVRALCAPNRRVYDAVRARIEQRGSWLK